MGRYAILCVDDEEIILNTLESFLERHFGEYCDIELASNAEDGLEIVKGFVEENVEIVVIISDWLMPGMKGDEFLIEVNKICPAMEKIMLSGHAHEDAVKKAKDVKALDKFIAKPWNSENLADIISSKLKSHGCNIPQVINKNEKYDEYNNKRTSNQF